MAAVAVSAAAGAAGEAAATTFGEETAVEAETATMDRTRCAASYSRLQGSRDSRFRV